jgi:hypothetical protein
MFEPASQGYYGTFSVMENIYREYVEELFGEEEPEFNDDPFWYKKTRAYAALRGYLDTGGGSIFLTGIATNLLNLRPEVCTLLLFESPDWGSEELGRLKRNWEYHRKLGFDIPLGPELETSGKYEELAPTEIVVPGAAAFALGFRLASARTQRR